MDCKNEECKNFWSCKMLFERFHVKECAIGKKMFTDVGHKRELEVREDLLKGLSE